MEFRIFFGAHLAGMEHLRKQLEHNSALLEEHGILLPDEDTMQEAVWAAILAVRQKQADALTLPTLVQRLTGGKSYKKVLILRPAISGSPIHPVKGASLYPRGSTTVAQLNRLIDQDNMRLFCAIRNPASFLPACYNLALTKNPNLSFIDFVSEGNVAGLRWSEYLQRVQGRESELPLTVWSYEDYPYIWRGAVQALTGLPNKEDLVGIDAPFDQGMSLKGASLMHRYFQEHPTDAFEDREKIATRFEAKFPPYEGESVPEIWPQDYVTSLSDSYDDDLYYIERMDNVRLIKRMHWM